VTHRSGHLPGAQARVSCRTMSDMDEEDNPATRIANRISECLAVVVPLGSTPEWERFCETVAASERKQTILWALSELVSAAPLLELPTVHGPKPMTRRLMAIAAELQRLVAAWDDNAEPSPAIITAAHRFIDCMRDPEGHLDLP
jgi:hypothetical protein